MTKEKIMRQYEPHIDNMLMILQALQNFNPENYLADADIKLVADYLNTTLSAVYGVVRYYTMFSATPRGRFVLRVCASCMCEIGQQESLLETLKRELNIEVGKTTSDGLFTLEATECLGHCSEPGVIMINQEVYAGLNADKVKLILKEKKRSAEKAQ